jgi:two-component system NarL family sensor kinase
MSKDTVSAGASPQPRGADAPHPLVRRRREIADAWVARAASVCDILAHSERDLLQRAIEPAVDAILRASMTHDFAALDEYLLYLDLPMNKAGLSVGEITRIVMAGVEGLDDALTPAERRAPEVLEAERCIRELVSRAAERAVDVITVRLEDEVRAQEDSRARLVALQRIGAAVTSSLDLDTALETIVQEAANLFDASSARLRLVDDNGESLVLKAGAGELGSSEAGAVPIESTLAGLCFRSGEPVFSDDVEADPRADQTLRLATQARSLLCVPMMSRGAAIGVLSIANLAERPFDDADSEMLSLLADHAATAVVNGRLFEQAQGQITELEILNRVSAVVSASLELETVYGAIHQEIARIMVADAFLIMLRNENGEFDLAYIVDEGVRFASRSDVPMPAAYVETIERRVPMIIEANLHPDFGSWERYGDMGRRVQSLLVAPLVRGGEAIGLISTQSYLPRSYRPRDVALFITIANVAAVAIENARLYDQAHDLAVAEERNRLAREIHDTLAQGLVGIILQLEALSAALDAQAPLQRRVNRAMELARVNLDEARRSVRNLRAAPLAQQSLADALRQLAEEHKQDCGGEVLVELPFSMPHLHAEVETTLFRLAQEALTNCRKHAGAELVWVELSFDTLVRLTIADNGVGFDIDSWMNQSPTHRFGLHGMRERVARLGGVFQILPRPGGGTLVNAMVPLEPPAN